MSQDDAALRDERALKMIARGYRYQAIMEHLGYDSVEAVQSALDPHLEKIDENNSAENRALQTMELRNIIIGLFNQLEDQKKKGKDTTQTFRNLIYAEAQYTKLNATNRLPAVSEGVQDIRREYIGVNIEEV